MGSAHASAPRKNEVMSPFPAALLDLKGRSRVVAAGTDALCAQIAAALSA
jgi:hypothetical protein